MALLALLKYLKHYSKDEFSAQNWSLSTEVPSRAITRDNQEMKQTLANQSAKSKKEEGSLQKLCDTYVHTQKCYIPFVRISFQ